jgi:hypothetical membrane protein
MHDGATSIGLRGRGLLWVGLLSGPLFLAALFVFGNLNPGYSHLHNAVSRLGAFGAPLFWLFDLVGLFVPGLLIAGVALQLRRAESFRGFKTWSSAGLIAFGLMQSLAAIPADFARMYRSPWTIAHAIFVLAPILLFFVVVPGCARSLRRLGASRGAAAVFLCLGYLPAAEFLLYGVTSTPGLVQRLMILTVHACSGWLSWVLIGLFKQDQPERTSG